MNIPTVPKILPLISGISVGFMASHLKRSPPKYLKNAAQAKEYIPVSKSSPRIGIGNIGVSLFLSILDYDYLPKIKSQFGNKIRFKHKTT